jgi:uncharacterized protein
MGMSADTWELKPEDFFNALLDQNPWIQLGRVPETLARPIRRPLAEELWRSMIRPQYRHQVVLGPRRVGKTVAMYQTIQQLLDAGIAPTRLFFLRLDHPLLMHHQLSGWAKAIIKRYSASREAPLFLFLDEVNYARNWDKWLKTFYDEQWPLRIVATSSATAALRDRNIESGIGRWSEQFLTPYTFDEFLDLKGYTDPRPAAGDHLFDTVRSAIEAGFDHTRLDDALQLFLLVGGFPELLDAVQETDLAGELLRSQQVLRSEAVQRVAGMDIPQAFDIRNPLTLERLLYLLAGQMCGLINNTKLATTLELARQTIHQYIRYLEQSYLIFTLPNFATSEEKIQRKGRKVYFVDGAVRNAALQRGLAPMRDPQEQGILLENAAASHLYSLSLQSGMRLFHWRDDRDEVDLIYSDPAGPIAFEIASSDRHSTSGLKQLERRYPEFQGRCFLVTSRSGTHLLPERSSDGVGRITLSTFLLTVGAQTRKSLHQRLAI